MKHIKLEDILAKANEKYVDAKTKQGYYNPSYSPPEFRPEIRSEQLKAVAGVLVNELNQAIAEINNLRKEVFIDLRKEILAQISRDSSTCASLGAESAEPQ